MGHGAQTSDISSRQMAFLSAFTGWAQAQAGIDAVALIGSHASGAARPDSDVDLLILADDPAGYIANTAWIERFGTPSAFQPEDYGAVQSLRVFYDNGLEVEFGFTSMEWAATTPVDEGTEEVVRDGAVVLVDTNGRFEALIRAIGKPT